MSGANGKSLLNIQYLKSLNFSIPQFLIPNSAFPNPKSKAVAFFTTSGYIPCAFAYSSAADGQYHAGETFGRYGGV